MKIGILYIGIGRYSCFWKDFYESCEKFLIPEAEKHYYVFTNNESFIKSSERISIFHQDDMGWPCNSLLRFKMFRRIKNLLKGNDYLFFFNSNAKIVLPVSAHDILPEGEDEFSAMCIDENPYSSGFEQRQISACYVKVGETQYYFSGALNGGKTESYIHLIETCDEIVDTELRNGIMPKWHDESVLNRYLIGKRTKVMYRDMGKPANWHEPRNAKIILRRKEDILGRNWLRNYKGREHTNTWLRKLLRKIGIIK
jgi:hypothetical protein